MLSFEAWPFQEKELWFSVKISRALQCAPNPVQSVPQDAGSLLEQGQKTTEHVAKQKVQTQELRTGDDSSSFRPETAALHPMEHALKSREYLPHTDPQKCKLALLLRYKGWRY